MTLAWLTAALWLTAAPVLAAVSAEAVVGFDGRFRLGAWVPVQLSLLNTGPGFAARVELSLQAGNPLTGNQHQMSQARSVHLGSGTRRQLEFTFFIESIAHPLVVRVFDGDRLRHQQALTLRPRFTGGGLIVVLAGNADLDYLSAYPPGEQLQSRPRDEATASRLVTAYPLDSTLPRVWYGYESVQAMVVHGRSLEQLSDEQLDALRRWLAAGGRLVVPRSSNPAVLDTPALRALLPETTFHPDTGLPSPTATLPEPAFMQTASPRAASPQVDVLRGADGAALAAWRRFGFGYVVHMNLDPASRAFRDWPGAQSLWRLVLNWMPTGAASPPAPPLVAAARPAPRAADALARAHQHFRARWSEVSPGLLSAWLSTLPRPWPGFATVLAFAAAYLAALAALGAGSGRGRRRTTVALCTLPLLAAAAAWLLLNAQPGRNQVLLNLAVIERLPDAPFAQAHFELATYTITTAPWHIAVDTSAPAWRHLSAHSGDVSPEAAAHDADASAVPGYPGWRVEHRGDTVGATHTWLAPTDPRAFRLHQLVADEVLPFAVQARILRAPGQRTMTLAMSNQGPVPWLASWLVTADGVLTLGALEQGAARLVSGPAVPANEGPESQRTWTALLQAEPSLAGLPTRALAAALAARFSRGARQRGNWLVALAPNPLRARLHPPEDAAQHALAIVFAPVPTVGDTAAPATPAAAPHASSSRD